MTGNVDKAIIILAWVYIATCLYIHFLLANVLIWAFPASGLRDRYEAILRRSQKCRNILIAD